jgi:hypothetical protein
MSLLRSPLLSTTPFVEEEEDSLISPPKSSLLFSQWMSATRFTVFFIIGITLYNIRYIYNIPKQASFSVSLSPSQCSITSLFHTRSSISPMNWYPPPLQRYPPLIYNILVPSFQPNSPFPEHGYLVNTLLWIGLVEKTVISIGMSHLSLVLYNISTATPRWPSSPSSPSIRSFPSHRSFPDL